MKILVVDDEPMIREIARVRLTSAGYEVLEASDGREALVLVRKEQPALILLDLSMPEMSGLDVVREIRNDPRLIDIRVLIMTAIDPDEEVSSALRHYGVAEILSKAEFVKSVVSPVQKLLSIQAHHVA